jgi:hypothetical protein
MRGRKTRSTRINVQGFKQMSKTIIAGRITREELKKARESEVRPFLRLAGTIVGPKDLSKRKGFSRE